MDDNGNQVLPYRTDGKDLTRLIEARAKGRSLKQIQALNFSSAGFQGTLAAAQSLKLFDAESSDLSELGRAFALSSSNKERQHLLLKAMLGYEPYELLLAAIFDPGPANETTTEWIETWWNTHGFGNSARNRSDGSTTFAKLVEYTELGTFYIGRRGRPSRIEWRDDAKHIIENAKRRDMTTKDEAVDEDPILPEQSNKEQSASLSEQSRLRQADNKDINSALSDDISTLALNLGSGRIARISLPTKLTSQEKERLMNLVDLMIVVESEE